MLNMTVNNMAYFKVSKEQFINVRIQNMMDFIEVPTISLISCECLTRFDSIN